MIRILAGMVSSFAIGSVPTAYWMGLKLRGIDLRREGSGNVGATNAVRVMGKGIGLSVFAIDLLKGFLPTFLIPQLLGTPAWSRPLMAACVGLAAIAGHVFSPFLKFKGGKGIATGAGVVCAVNAPFFLASISLWGVCFYLTRTVSISSLVSVLSLLVMSLAYRQSWPYPVFFLLLFAIALWTHRENIRRLMRGEENTFR